MLINTLLVLGTLAVIVSWVVAVALLRSDKFADTTIGQAPATNDYRTDVLAGSSV